jgi:DNA-directed RNA polymerase subunit RPC12/RpoP
MREVNLRGRIVEGPFEYYCPVCGITLSRSNYETFDAEYYCPYCSSRQRPSRVPARYA